MIQIEWMKKIDVSEVLKRTPLTEAELNEMMRQRDPPAIGIIATDNNQLVGFMIYELHKDRLVIKEMASDTWEVQEAFVTKMKSKLRADGRCRIEWQIPLDPEEVQWWVERGFKASFDRQDEEIKLSFKIESQMVKT